MDLFTGDDLALLARHRQQPSVSVFTPLERGGLSKKTNEIRLKDLLSEAARRLDDRQGRPSGLLGPARRLLEDMHFTRHDSDGLAVFIAPGVFRHYSLPSAFEPVVVVSDRFHVKPLIPMLSEDGRFYVLALSQNSVRLLQCSRYHCRHVDLRETPTSMAEALRFDEPQHQRSAHSGGPTGSGRGGMVFHTQADDSDKSVHKENVRQFLHQVENGVTRVLTGEKAPLVVAAVGNVRAIYGEVNTYPHLVEGHVDGNPDHVRDDELREAGWAIVEPVFAKARRDAVGLFQRVAGTEKAGGKLREILQAAAAGRVQVLLTARSRQVWGTWDAEAGRAEVHDEEQTGDEDLLNHAAVEALLHGASVFALEPEEMPDGRAVAAVYRY